MLDFLYIAPPSENACRFSIADSEVSLFDAAFRFLEKKSGIYIDPYGTNRIYPDHQKVLLDFLAGETHETVRHFLVFLEKAFSSRATVLVERD